MGDYHIYLIKELTIKDDAKARFEAVKKGESIVSQSYRIDF